MDHLTKLTRQYRQHLFVIFGLQNLLVLGSMWAVYTYLHLPFLWIILGGAVLGGLLIILVTTLSTNFLIQPTKALWQAVVHLSPQSSDVPAPDVNKLTLGRELVASLTAQIYQLATNAEHLDAVTAKQGVNARAEFVMNNLPLPLFILNPDKNITYANDAACKYLGVPAADLDNKNVYSALDMSFPNDQTFDKWLSEVQVNSATASKLWERVRLNVTDNQPTRLFDLAAYYNQGNTDHNETMLVLFDHTKSYSQDDQAVSFIALSVHELRTPLTILRGYIEAFEEEFEGKLSPELQDFMRKMSATAQQLTAFVNNILNVARVDEDQLVLQLTEQSWPDVIQNAVNTMQLRASVRGLNIECTVAPDLPTVGVDRVSIQEVLNNLIDNAIKYTGKSTRIVVNTYLNKEGLVETTIQDWGVGIPPNIMANLFTKFYRDHRNRAQIGGTGLGLYLSKSIVTAHGGNIWVKSKEGEGSVFAFTLVPYAQLAQEIKDGNNGEIVRGAHGWIKNHSLYRR